jgi:hypothetical protein
MPAYAPRGGFTAENCGVLAVGDSSIDVRAALQEGDGVLVVPDSDTVTQVVLDEYPPLKRVAVPDEPASVVDQFEALPHQALKDEARVRGLKVSGSSEELRDAIRAHDAGQEA